MSGKAAGVTCTPQASSIQFDQDPVILLSLWSQWREQAAWRTRRTDNASTPFPAHRDIGGSCSMCSESAATLLVLHGASVRAKALLTIAYVKMEPVTLCPPSPSASTFSRYACASFLSSFHSSEGGRENVTLLVLSSSACHLNSIRVTSAPAGRVPSEREAGVRALQLFSGDN
ncbi:Uncharacterized protein DAT39_002870 [Clarias magur]|uniref:Uncharacterized protein n=1 Tax=Clarias magur TaxID=1594786 RepID=A0A8J4UTW3_CLAMG|nr:Uncharacterized protein DAT39_002870 [Clarias magur]